MQTHKSDYTNDNNIFDKERNTLNKEKALTETML